MHNQPLIAPGSLESKTIAVSIQALTEEIIDLKKEMKKISHQLNQVIQRFGQA